MSDSAQTYEPKLFLAYKLKQIMSSHLIDKNDSGDSVMRDFLQSGIEFKWPPGLGECSDNHCDLKLDIKGIPLQWKKKISDKKASIDIYEAPPGINFRKPFVVKTLRDSDSKNARTMTAKEVENMRGLRHPHITALLGTFTYQARLNIMIFPAARWDLQQFMDRMSKGTSTLDSTTSNPQQLHGSDATSSGQSGHHGARSDSWSIMLPSEREIEMLRGYFVCLSQALRYLHEQGVRHKDIKPANILIDESESVILTDFGISRRFPKDEPHVTNNEWNFTRKYASPEIMKDRKMPRDDTSDVFSLGCVFLEMATLLLENTLNGLSDHYSITVNESAKDEAYHRNLEKVHEWIDQLRNSRDFRPVLEHWAPGDGVVLVSQEFRPSFDNHLTAALVDIRQMLDENPQNRPASKTLWHRFQDISPKTCRDCDPRSREMWKPSARQQVAAKTGLSNRRSLHTKEIEFESSRDAIREADSTMLSALDVPRQPSPQSRSTVVSRPDSPRSKVNVDTGGNANQVPMSPPPGLDKNLETANPQDIQESVPTFSKATMQDRSPNGRFAHHETLVRILEKDMPRPETPIIVYDVSQRIAFQTDCAWLKGIFKGADCSCEGLVLRSYADVTPGQEILGCPLPRVRQKVEISHKAKFIAKVDLGRLGWRTRMRRWRGRFPRLYVVH